MPQKNVKKVFVPKESSFKLKVPSQVKSTFTCENYLHKFKVLYLHKLPES